MHHSRKRPDRHCDHNLFSHRDTAILGAEDGAGRAQFITPLRSPEKNVHQQTTKQREDEREIDWNPLRQARYELAQARDVSSPTDRNRLHDRITGRLVVVLHEVTQQRHGEEVQHDRVDDFVRTEARFEYAGNCSPNSAADNRRDKQNGTNSQGRFAK